MRMLLVSLLCLAPAVAAADGLLLVVNKSADAVGLHDLATGQELARLPTGNGPHEIAVSPDGRRAVATDYGRDGPGHSLTVLDLVQRKVERRIDLERHGRPHGIAFFADGRRVAVTTEASGHLLVVDVAAGRIEQAVPTGQEVSHMVALAPDGARAFVANIGSGSLTVIDLKAGRVERQVPTGAGAEGVALTRDGREVWVSNRAADTITVVDARSLAPVATLPAKGFPIRVAMMPDGRQALVTHAKSGELAVFDVAARREVRRLRVGGEGGFSQLFGAGSFPVGVIADPDGTRVFVAITGSDRIAVVDARGWAVTGAWPAGDEPDGMAIVPRANARH